MTKDQYFEQRHRKNLKTVMEFAKLVAKGIIRISDIRIEYPQFGNSRIVIFFKEVEKNDG